MEAKSDKTVFVAGHNGMVGRALTRRLEQDACTMVTAARSDLDLRDQSATFQFLEKTRPDVVYIAAARVGGIGANMAHPAGFLYDNLSIATNLIEGARRAGVAKLVMIASSAVYPMQTPQPYKEDALMAGPYDPRHDGYAMAKLAAIKMCQTYRREFGCDFISVLPTNLYGCGDNYRTDSSHVLAALMRRFVEAKNSGADAVEIWGSGKAQREFLYADDLADALVHLADAWSDEAPVNIGSGHEVSIAALAQEIAQLTGFSGRIEFNTDKPDGALRRALDSTRLAAAGWQNARSLRDGLADIYSKDFDNGRCMPWAA